MESDEINTWDIHDPMLWKIVSTLWRCVSYSSPKTGV